MRGSNGTIAWPPQLLQMAAWYSRVPAGAPGRGPASPPPGTSGSAADRSPAPCWRRTPARRTRTRTPRRSRGTSGPVLEHPLDLPCPLPARPGDAARASLGQSARAAVPEGRWLWADDTPGVNPSGTRPGRVAASRGTGRAARGVGGPMSKRLALPAALLLAALAFAACHPGARGAIGRHPAAAGVPAHRAEPHVGAIAHPTGADEIILATTSSAASCCPSGLRPACRSSRSTATERSCSSRRRPRCRPARTTSSVGPAAPHRAAHEDAGPGAARVRPARRRPRDRQDGVPEPDDRRRAHGRVHDQRRRTTPRPSPRRPRDGEPARPGHRGPQAAGHAGRAPPGLRPGRHVASGRTSRRPTGP